MNQIPLRTRHDIPYFYFENIEKRENQTLVDVAHGVPLAATGETFVFQIDGAKLTLIERYWRWVS